MPWARAGRLAALAALCSAALAAPAIAAPVEYPYRITLAGSGSAQFDDSTCCVREYGDMSASYKVVYEVLVTVDHAAQTVDVDPLDRSRIDGITGAKSLEGIDSFKSTATCISSSCTGPDTVCSFSNVPFGQSYLGPENVYLQNNWGYGQDRATYAAGVIRMTERSGGAITRGGESFKCQGTDTYRYPMVEMMPGLLGPIEIPLARIGEERAVVEYDVGPTSDWGLWLQATGSWRYKITFDLLSVRVTGAQLDFEERARRRAAKLRAEMIPLAERKAKLEQSILDGRDKAEKAIKGIEGLRPEIRRVGEAIDDTFDALRRLKREEDSLPQEVRGLMEAEERYGREIASLETRILGAERGEGAAKLRKELRRARNQLDAVEDVLKRRLRGTEYGDLREKWLGRLRKLRDRSFDLSDEQSRLLGRQGAAEAGLSRDAIDLRGVDAALFDIGQALTRFDPEVYEVTGMVAGKRVFHAAAAYSYADLLRINQAIARQQATLDRIQAKKTEAFNNFKAVQKEAIEAQKDLANLLYKLAYARFFVDFAFDAADIIKATGKGGIVGAVAEFGKKLLEKGLKEVAGSPDSGIDPDSIEAQINKEFKAGLKDAFSTPQIARVASERVLKETLTKATKDTANQYLGSRVFDKLEYAYQFRLKVEPRLIPGTATDYAKAERALEKLTDQLKSLRKGYLENFAGKPELRKFFAGVGESLVKDALKTVAKGAFDKAERDAWRDFFVKESFARGFFEPYRLQSELWEKALQEMDVLLRAKAQLLQDGKEGELVTDLSTPFAATGELAIDLRLGGYRDPADAVAVFVNGVQATKTGETSYTIPVGSIPPAADRTLAITLR